jgi:hypothetical protein
MVIELASCRFQKDNGEPCRATPMRGEEYCFWHHPEHAEEAAEARRLGGLRRRRERVTQGAYDFAGLQSVADIRRLLEIAVVDTLGLESSIARSRALAYLAQMALKALEVGELEERVRALEQVTRPRMKTIRGRR